MVFEEIFEEVEELPMEMRQILHKMSEEDLKLQETRFQLLKLKHKLYKDCKMPIELYSAIDMDECDDEFICVRNQRNNNTMGDSPNKKRAKAVDDVNREIGNLYSVGRDSISQKIYEGDYGKELIQKYIQKLDSEISRYDVIVNGENAKNSFCNMTAVTPIVSQVAASTDFKSPSCDKQLGRPRSRRRKSDKENFPLDNVGAEWQGEPEAGSPTNVSSSFEFGIEYTQQLVAPAILPSREGGGDDPRLDPSEPLYCFCRQVSFGDMVECDSGEKCSYGWFHYSCVGLVSPPNGSWYCSDCRYQQLIESKLQNNTQ